VTHFAYDSRRGGVPTSGAATAPMRKHLKYYLAMCERHINLKRITPKFIAQLVAERQSVT
jgi:hypothetical protein